MLQLNDRFFLQSQGIPQGSLLSSLLCCIYLAQIENQYILPAIKQAERQERKQELEKRKAHEQSSRDKNPKKRRITLNRSISAPVESDQVSSVPSIVNEQLPPRTSSSVSRSVASTQSSSVLLPLCSLLIRQVDDFCFLTTSQSAAKTFYQAFQKGFKQEGIYCNAQKTQRNFATDEEKQQQMEHQNNITSITWNGYLIKLTTLEVQLDYSRSRDTGNDNYVDVLCYSVIY